MREVTKRPRSYGHEFVDMLNKHWAKKGTAPYPVVFQTPDGTKYRAENVQTQDSTTTINIVQV